MNNFKQRLEEDPYLADRCPLLFDYGYCLAILVQISVSGESNYLKLKDALRSLRACVDTLRDLPVQAKEPLVVDLIQYFDSFHSRLNNAHMSKDAATSFNSCIVAVVGRSLLVDPDGMCLMLGRTCFQWESLDASSGAASAVRNSISLPRVTQALTLAAENLSFKKENVQSALKAASVESAKALVRRHNPYGHLKSIVLGCLRDLLPSFWQPSPDGKSRVAGVEVTDTDYEVLCALRRAGNEGLSSDALQQVCASGSHRLREIRGHPILSRYISATGRARWLDESVPLPPQMTSKSQ